MRIDLVFSLGVVVLGCLGVVYADFALQWQPVPADLPGRTPLAYLSAFVLTIAAAMTFVPRTRHAAMLALAVCFALWVALLHLPRVIAAPLDVSQWLGLAEISLLAIGAAAGARATSTVMSSQVSRALELAAGPCLLVFGLSHFVYAQFTAQMVPGWLPWPLFWAYATGCGHLAAGLSFLVGVADRLASVVFAMMLSAFVVLLHIPRVIADPGNRLEWTMLAIAASLSGAAWLLARSVRLRAPNPRPAFASAPSV
jgi:uncharacterized membrane protein YphA (DoxX/SURF4 family)